MSSRLQLAVIASLPFMENTYVARLEDREDCVVFDPGLEPAKILEFLDREKLSPAALLITHGHGDHIGGIEALKQRWPACPVVIGGGDAGKLSDPQANLSAMFGFDLICPPADVLVHEGETYEAAGMPFEVLETPGHSAGHVVYLWRGAVVHVFGGDVLFAGGIGRTDFPDGSFEDLAASIRGKLYTLPDETIVLPGHGEPTTVGAEKRSNPFVRP